MKNTRFWLLPAVLLLAAGCREDDLIDCAPTAPPVASTDAAMRAFTRRNGVPVQTFTVTLKDSVNTPPRVLTTAAGATLLLPANGFRLPSGAVAAGRAQVQLRELYTVPDMLLSNVPTNLAMTREALVAGGEFAIQVFQNGTRLRLAVPAQLLSPVPMLADTAQQRLFMRPFAGNQPDTIGWVATQQRVSVLNAVPASQPARRYYTLLPLDTTTWWGIHKVWSSTVQVAPVRVQVEVPATQGVRVFLRPTGTNRLLAPFRTVATDARWYANLPPGTDVLAVVIQATDSQLYYGTQRFTAQANLVVKPTLTPLSEADVVRLIRQL